MDDVNNDAVGAVDTSPDPSLTGIDSWSGPVGYVLQAFPQLSETFIENELSALARLGVAVEAFSVYRPPAGLEGPTTFPSERLHYRPGIGLLLLEFFRWLLLRPGPTTRNVLDGLSLRSQTMLRGAVSAGWLATHVRRRGIRHLHAHFAIDSSAWAAAAARLAGVPFTFTVHAHEIYLRPNGLCHRSSQADRVVTVCQYNIDQLQRLCPQLSRDRIELVYCGVDPSAFHPAHGGDLVPRGETDSRPQVPGGPLRILSVGRLVPTKGFEDLIDAVGQLVASGVEVRCDIVGQGPLQADLTARIARLGPDAAVTLVGPRTPTEVAQLMAQTDLFVLASRIAPDGNRDSMPVVIKEAMATGVPVVATTTAGIPEMVDDQVGRIAAPDDPASLAAAIREIAVLTPTERAALGRAGRDRVEEHFNIVRETEKLRSLFGAIAQDRAKVR